MWNQVKKAIRQSKRFVITSHIHPDGDALGSELGLYYFLKSLGKQAIILNATKPARNFTFMGKNRVVRVYNDNRDRHLIDQADAVFIVDISEWDRLGIVGKKIKQSRAKKICVDHHICQKPFVDIHAIDNKSGSTGELIYRLIKSMKKPINHKIAEPLYIAALTDTGSFHYSNTSPETHLMVSELLRYGVNPLKSYNKIYEQYRMQRFRLLGRVLLEAKLECRGKFAWAAVTRNMTRHSNASMEEADGFAEILRTVHSVDVSVIFKEYGKSKTGVSLRSKETADVHAVAHKLGGGGHKRASGITIELPLKKAVPLVLKEVRKQIKKRGSK